MLAPDKRGRAEVRTSPLHGRGLFASRLIPEGGVIGVYPLLVLSHEDTATLKSTRLYHYVFYVDERADGAIRAAVAFGEISMCNHSPAANAEFEVDAVAQTVTLTASADLPAGTEILIDYQEFAEEAL
ncbi:SET domain-containing protein-lysine N-methyltransferase [Hyphomonas sp.]|uniref:SET domain-containing protein n=1 Tax=Hyphomonas sp. TaxID=87 RepID=UPI0025B875C5|nr:SET domain-containing protein-lysine N-methyltransferase [Hyphomonas sp.]MBI1400384.1 SET domain-containing protein-lysine N-methyltransferase [Hyphomonas sp.]